MMGKVILSTDEINKLMKQCRSSLNWTDGGYWMGSGPEPNCFRRSTVVTNKMETLTKFPSDESANAWNDEWETLLRRKSYITGFAVGLLTAALSYGVAVSSALAIALEESAARRGYPRVERGWSYQLVVTHTYTQHSPHTGRQPTFTQSSVGTVRSHLNTVKSTHSSSREYSTENFPDSLARTIAAMPNSRKVIVYQPSKK